VLDVVDNFEAELSYQLQAGAGLGLEGRASLAGRPLAKLSGRVAVDRREKKWLVTAKVESGRSEIDFSGGGSLVYKPNVEFKLTSTFDSLQSLEFLHKVQRRDGNTMVEAKIKFLNSRVQYDHEASTIGSATSIEAESRQLLKVDGEVKADTLSKYHVLLDPSNKWPRTIKYELIESGQLSVDFAASLESKEGRSVEGTYTLKLLHFGVDNSGKILVTRGEKNVRVQVSSSSETWRLMDVNLKWDKDEGEGAYDLGAVSADLTSAVNGQRFFRVRGRAKASKGYANGLLQVKVRTKSDYVYFHARKFARFRWRASPA